MKIKKGDEVVVISGKYKGVKGKVLEARPTESRVVVEGVNRRKWHIKPTQEQLDAELQKTADMYKMEMDKIKEMISDYEMEQVTKAVAVQQALDLIIDASKEA